MSSAADAAANAVEGVPPWLIYLGSAVLTPLVGVFVLWLRRLLRVEEPTEQTETEAPPTPQGAPPVTPQTPTTQPTSPTPDPEIALIAETLRDYRDELRAVRAAMSAAEDRHRQEMAAAEARHSAAMSEVRTALDDREKTIVRLEAMIDVLRDRR